MFSFTEKMSSPHASNDWLLSMLPVIESGRVMELVAVDVSGAELGLSSVKMYFQSPG